VHHTRARRWFEQVHESGWATSPATETGFVRVSSNRRALPEARSPEQAIALLCEMREVAGHRFWPDRVSPCGDAAGFFGRVVGYRQVTDAWLVTLAHEHDGRLATFDRSIVELAGDRADELVELIP